MRGGWTPVVRGVSMMLERGEFVGVVGESGSGKSLTALSVMGLLPPVARARGRVWLDGEVPGAAAQDLLTLDERQLCHVRGGRIGMVFQEPSTSLNPVLSIGYQIAEAVRAHGSVAGAEPATGGRRPSRAQARREAERLLDLVAMPDARRRLDDYPHQLSGGQRQRVMIAMALAGNPDLLLADEPTTALDVTIQAQILDLLEGLRRDLDLTILLITHDLAVVAETCERVLVMYAGQVVESAPVERLFEQPAHPYSRGLLAALPRLGAPRREGGLATIPGQVPVPGRLPSGCAFHPRCRDAMARCSLQEPELWSVSDLQEGVDLGDEAGVRARCFLYDRTSAQEGPPT